MRPGRIDYMCRLSCNWEGKLEDGKETADCKRIQDVDEWAKKVKELTHSHDES